MAMASIITRFTLHFQKNSTKKYIPLFTAFRESSIKLPLKVKRGTIRHRNLISAEAQRLADRGFLRFQKPYTPPEDVEEKVSSVCKSVLGGNYENNLKLSDIEKFNLLHACFKKLQHTVPNSMLYQIETVSDILEFYKKPVITTTPYDELQKQSLPPNLCIQKDYLRFHPETDKLFGGITAYPESSTLVTGLKSKKKYKGHSQRLPVYYDNWADYVKKNFYNGSRE